MPTQPEINAGKEALLEHCRANGIWITGQDERSKIVTAILEAAEKARENLYGLPLPSTIEQRHV